MAIPGNKAKILQCLFNLLSLFLSWTDASQTFRTFILKSGLLFHHIMQLKILGPAKSHEV